MRIAVSTLVRGTADRLFWLSQDYARRCEWDVYLEEAYLLEGCTQAAIGAQSYCRNRQGAVLVSTYISFAPPTHAAVRMTRGPWILQRFAGSWRFGARADGIVEVGFTYNFACRPRQLGKLLEPLVALVYRRDMYRRLQAFKQWAEADIVHADERPGDRHIA